MNSLKKFREKVLMSKSELARKAGLSALTIDRIERGMSCRLETKRKIILALGLQLSDKGKIFSEDRSWYGQQDLPVQGSEESYEKKAL